MMDPDFITFDRMLEQLFSFPGKIMDEENGIVTTITSCTIETPIELDVRCSENGSLRIGSTPPLYYARTTFLPSFHRMKVVATLSNGAGNGH
jgi:hypothetical protein